MRFLKRQIKTLSYAANGTDSLDLPRNYQYHQLGLRLKGIVTVGTAAATAILQDSPFSLVERIEVVVNGKDTIKSYSGRDLKALMQINSHTLSEVTQPGKTVAAHSFNAYMVVDFAMPNAKVELDTLANSAIMSTFQLRVVWAAETALLTPAATTTLAVSACTLAVSSIESIGSAPESVFMTNKEYIIEKEVTSTTSSFQIDLPADNTYRRLVLISTDAGVRESDIINSITLKSGTDVFVQIDAPSLIDSNKLDFELEAVSTGVYVIDLSKYGSMRDILDMSQRTSFELVLDVAVGAGTTKIRVIPQQVVVPSK